jgi:hypothetical protein
MLETDHAHGEDFLSKAADRCCKESEYSPLYSAAKEPIEKACRRRCKRVVFMSRGGEGAMARYPDILIQYVNWCGNRLQVRHVRLDDAPKFVTASLLRSAADLRFRFLSRMYHLSEKLATQFTLIDYQQNTTFAADTAAMEA